MDDIKYYRSINNHDWILKGNDIGNGELYLLDETCLVRDWYEYDASEFTLITKEDYTAQFTKTVKNLDKTL
ncbi:hypothetical protein M4D76_27635 [Peribacillus frigoritolerans]|uniref:hypothetical protein n=1 Tax=Peribacillus frigoritolerans TaxID=450367 RepID=UPI0021A8F9B0|nr:hypothetical protein [Peribacillus frigoritolerans]MCT1392020.1 hypothetical protein [Peribacillus frigoritolerans]